MTTARAIRLAVEALMAQRHGEEGREAEMNQAMRILTWYTPLQTPWAGRVRVVGDVDASS